MEVRKIEKKGLLTIYFTLSKCLIMYKLGIFLVVLHFVSLNIFKSLMIISDFFMYI